MKSARKKKTFGFRLPCRVFRVSQKGLDFLSLEKTRKENRSRLDIRKKIIEKIYVSLSVFPEEQSSACN
ncbi:hypothetical protein LEP1GSC120_0530 [Leptospira santarosai str. 200702252]|nr:hypothetical protein LEP1GSC120_0530 [Leptospira santarosai str. 200702252]